MEVEKLEVVGYSEPFKMKGRRGKGHKGYRGPENLIERMAAFLEDEDYISLKEECALARSLLDGMLEADREWEELVAGMDVEEVMKRGLTSPPYSPDHLLKALRQVSQIVEKEYKIKFGDANLITIDAAIGFALAVATLVNQFVEEPKQRKAVIEGIRGLLSAGKGFDINLRVARAVLSPEMQEEAEEEEKPKESYPYREARKGFYDAN